MTRSVRLTLARAASTSNRGSAAAWLLGAVGLGRARQILAQTGFEFLLDLQQVVRLGLEVARMRPLEARFERAADPPIGVAQMVVDGRIFRLQLHGAFEIAHRLVVLGDAERSEEHTSELQSLRHLVCRLLLEKK